MDEIDRTMNVWWVNQGPTYVRDKAEGYIWAPAPVPGGQTFPHWMSMTHVREGDVVVNVSQKNIVALSIAKGKAQKHVNKRKEGWRIDLDYHDLNQAITHDELQPYIPSIAETIETNSPFTGSQGLNQGFLFNFSVNGLFTLIGQFADRVPESVKPFLGIVKDTGFAAYLREKNFVFDHDLIRRYILSLLSTPLVILSGSPGTGKTKLAQLYSRYLDEQARTDADRYDNSDLVNRRWFKVSYNERSAMQAFQGQERGVNLLRKIMLKDGIMPMYGLDSKKNLDMDQKKLMKNLENGDVIIAYQGEFTVGGIGIVTQPQFYDGSGDVYELFHESTKSFIRLEWIFKGPLKISDFYLGDETTPAFSQWLDTIYPLEKRQVQQFVDYLKKRDIQIRGKGIYSHEKNYEIVSVGCNWADLTDLLGKIDGRGVFRPTKALELILNAQKAAKRESATPFFLILEDMNVASADHYLSEFLSAFESGEPIPLHNDDDVEQYEGIPCQLALPENIYVVGIETRNGTSHRISRKIMDQANVIEFSTLKASSYLNSSKKQGGYWKNIPFAVHFHGKDADPRTLLAAMAPVNTGDEMSENLKTAIVEELDLLGEVLKSGGFEMGFRTMDDIVRYMYLSWSEEDQPRTWARWADAFDAQIVQRIIPMIDGRGNGVMDVLKGFYGLCHAGMSRERILALMKDGSIGEFMNGGDETVRFPRTRKKLAVMIMKTETQGSVSLF